MNLARTLTAAAAALLLTTTACSNQSPIAPSTGGKEPSAKEVKAVGMTLQDVSNPFFGAMKHSVEELGKKEGFTVNVQDGQQDLGKQSDQLDAFVQQGVDVILLNAVDTDGVGPAVQRAIDAGVVVVAVDVDAANAQAVVSTDNVEAGRQACTALAEKIGGSGNIMIIDGVPVTSVQERVKGCHEVLASDFPEVKVVAEQNNKSDVGSGQQVATDMLTANKDVQGIFGNNDPTARGAVLALQQANRADVWVTGVDGSPEAVEEMGKAGSPFWATAAQDPGNMAVQGFELAKAIIGGTKPAERITLIKPEIVTQATLSDYKGWNVG